MKPSDGPPDAVDVSARLYQAALGPDPGGRYLRQFQQLDAQGMKATSWHWGASGSALLWLAWRGEFAAAALWGCLAMLGSVMVLGVARLLWGASGHVLAGLLLSMALAASAAWGLAAARLYRALCRRRILQAVAAQGSIAAACSQLQRTRPGLRSRLVALATAMTAIAGATALIALPVRPSGLAPQLAAPQPGAMPAPADASRFDTGRRTMDGAAVPIPGVDVATDSGPMTTSGGVRGAASGTGTGAMAMAMAGTGTSPEAQAGAVSLLTPETGFPSAPRTEPTVGVDAGPPSRSTDSDATAIDPSHHAPAQRLRAAGKAITGAGPEADGGVARRTASASRPATHRVEGAAKAEDSADPVSLAKMRGLQSNGPPVIAHMVQVGVFSRPENTRAAVDKLRAAGLTPLVDTLTPRGPERVRVGPFSTLAQAQRVKDRIQAAGLPATILRTVGAGY